ncbi:hypothetical protein PPACK8108_LOCUS1394 [Phakopsora pachyrhizi]|uniref:Uncharacterized protein n=1 Tax=Phakopsora pachyrhizi TaxID=170000 RepID=A0AAV0AJF7_PHAPC|nr:hypothetical protein PPACK8108_LOCUS1394 [Phakopsora pachyrhizi]
MEGLITGSKITTAEAGGLASFPKSTLVGAVHRSERGRRLRLTKKRPPTLTDSLQVGVKRPSASLDELAKQQGRCFTTTRVEVEVGLVQLAEKAIYTGNGMIESLIRRNGQNVLKLVAIADGLNNSQVSRDHRQGPGHREGVTW